MHINISNCIYICIYSIYMYEAYIYLFEATLIPY